MPQCEFIKCVQSHAYLVCHSWFTDSQKRGQEPSKSSLMNIWSWEQTYVVSANLNITAAIPSFWLAYCVDNLHYHTLYHHTLSAFSYQCRGSCYKWSERDWILRPQVIPHIPINMNRAMLSLLQLRLVDRSLQRPFYYYSQSWSSKLRSWLRLTKEWAFPGKRKEGSVRLVNLAL